jgi:hypothetical protein
MTRYEILKANEEAMWLFIQNGILSYQVIRDLEIYQEFISLGDLSNAAKYLILADSYELSSKRIEQIVNSMDK